MILQAHKGDGVRTREVEGQQTVPDIGQEGVDRQQEEDDHGGSQCQNDKHPSTGEGIPENPEALSSLLSLVVTWYWNPHGPTPCQDMPEVQERRDPPSGSWSGHPCTCIRYIVRHITSRRRFPTLAAASSRAVLTSLTPTWMLLSSTVIASVISG